MAFRIVRITNRCKLETRLNYLVCMKDKETKILLDEISVLIIESQQACITNALLSELVDHGIKVVFCDSKHNPVSELIPYFGSNDSYKKTKKQIQWDRQTKDDVWDAIVRMKIHNQAQLLKRRGFPEAYRKLGSYEKEVQDGDATNREGLAAKVYFAAIFGSSFDRRNPGLETNTFLDYGYAILLSIVNREIAAFGYLPQLGIHHVGETNPFNLGCDLVEPFRPFVDAFLLEHDMNHEDFKGQILAGLGMAIRCGERKCLLENAIHDFVISFLNAMEGHNPGSLLRIAFLDEQL